jgi:hypothetical protein
MREKPVGSKITMITDTGFVEVTWMDGTTVTYEGRTHVNEGVLHIYDVQQTLHIPLANIRYWKKP